MVDGHLVETPAGTPATSSGQCVVPLQADGKPAEANFAIWAEGNIDLGFSRRDEASAGAHFTTDGITVGVDRRVTENLAVGAGVGYGRDDSDVGVNGSGSKADGYSAFVYASWLPRKGMFVDTILGFTSMDFDIKRHVTETGGMLYSRRGGHQYFGSLSVGYEHYGDRLHLSPYGRIELSDITLRSFQEQGDDLWALIFEEQRSSRVRGVLGLRGDYLIERATGELRPNFRMEYLYDLKSGGQAGVKYADWIDSPLYQIQLNRYDDQNLLLGLGLRWDGKNGHGWAIGYEGTVRNEAAQSGTLRLDYSVKY